MQSQMKSSSVASRGKAFKKPAASTKTYPKKSKGKAFKNPAASTQTDPKKKPAAVLPDPTPEMRVFQRRARKLLRELGWIKEA